MKEGVSRLSDNSSVSFVIPNDLIVDLSLALTSDPSKRFYISEVVNLVDQVTITISDDSAVVCGSFIIPVSAHTLYKDYYLSVPSTGLYTGAAGRMTIGYLSTLQTIPNGTFSFSLASAELEMRATVPYQGSISRLVLVNADGTSFSLTGNVTIVARANVKFRADDQGVVYIDAGEGLGLNEVCDTPADPIYTINGVHPDATGNILLQSTDKCIQITEGGQNTLNISNSCCKPCLGCEEINTLTERAMMIETDMLKLREHYVQMTNLVNQFGTLVGVQCSC